MRILQIILFFCVSLLSFCADEFEMDFSDVDLFAGQRLEYELEHLEEITSLDVGTVLGMAPSYASGYSVELQAENLGKKKPDPTGGYYALNGNCDITIHGYEKQALYNNATYDWSLDASYLLPVSNVGYLTYGDITLCDVHALESGTDYSEFIYNVQINGFSTNFEYRLELHNGQVTLWSKLPGSTSVPEPGSVACGVLAALLLVNDRKRS